MLRTCDKFLKHTFETFSPSLFDRDYQLNETNLASFQAKLTLKGNFCNIHEIFGVEQF